MRKSQPERICMLPHLSGVGGMVSFQQKMAAGLARRGIQVCYDLADQPYQAVLVVGGTRQLPGLWQARRRGIHIVQRLDGMNWLHKVRTKNKTLRTGLKHYLRAEYGNLILASIRSRLAQSVVYQSEFSRDWWERVYGLTASPNKVVYNGVNLEIYSPDGPQQRPEDSIRVLMVEGSLLGGYEAGLEAAIRLVVELAKRLPSIGLNKPLELMVAGRVVPELRQYWDQRLKAWDERGKVALNWAGLLAGESIPMLDRSAHFLYSCSLSKLRRRGAGVRPAGALV
jgi:glycosyltransferase involved in cell wall biosynthesis